MATVYSLVCFGGRLGKTVTFTDAGDVVNLTTHGLRPGAGVIFSTTGALPTGLTAGTTYYAKQGADSGKFLLYPTSADAIAGTNQVTFTGAGSGTHTVKGAYFSSLSAGDLARYGESGSERIYDSLSSWNTGRAACSKLDLEICELAEAWTNWLPASFAVNIPAGAVLITSRVDGVRSEAYHWGQISDATTQYGFVANTTNTSATNTLQLVSANALLDGITVMRAYSASFPGVCQLTGLYSSAYNCIAVQTGGFSGTGFALGPVGAKVVNCLATGCNIGFLFNTYTDGQVAANCTAVKCNYGFYGGNPSYGYLYNNVALGNTTANWYSGVAGLRYATNNAGGTGEAWMTTGASRVEITEASPFSATFVDFTNGDYQPASASSQLVDAGVEYYQAPAYDLADDFRPAYMDGDPAYFDVGAYEFDPGFGPWPNSQPVEVVVLDDATGLPIQDAHVYLCKVSDKSQVLNGATNASGIVSTTLTYSSNITLMGWARQMDLSGTDYEAKDLFGTFTSTGISLTVRLSPI